MELTHPERLALLRQGVQMFRTWCRTGGQIECQKGVAPCPQFHFNGPPLHGPTLRDKAPQVYRAVYEWPGVIRVYASAHLVAESDPIKSIAAQR